MSPAEAAAARVAWQAATAFVLTAAAVQADSQGGPRWIVLLILMAAEPQVLAAALIMAALAAPRALDARRN